MSDIRFFTDEDVYGELAALLRSHGFDAISTPEADRLSAPSPSDSIGDARLDQPLCHGYHGGMDEPTFTIYFRGGPLHGRSHTGAIACGISSRIGQRYTVATEVSRGRISTIHEYEFVHVQGPMIVAQFMNPLTITDDRTQPSWGPWQSK